MEEKTIRCPECGSDVTPDEFNTCPTCMHRFSSFDYLQQGLKEEDFTNLREVKIPSSGALFGKIKVIGFIVVLFFIIFKFLTK